MDGKTKNYSDGKMVENIEDLFFEFLRVADDIKPKVIIAENVKGLTIGEIQKNTSTRFRIPLKILDMMLLQRY